MTTRYRKIVVNGLALAAICLLLAAILFPLLAQCKGSSTEFRYASAKLRQLITDYHAKAGKWPESYRQLVAALHPDSSFEYFDICDTWPTKRARQGTLRDVQLWRSPEGGEGVVCYRFKFKDNAPTFSGALLVIGTDSVAPSR